MRINFLQCQVQTKNKVGFLIMWKAVKFINTQGSHDFPHDTCQWMIFSQEN